MPTARAGFLLLLASWLAGGGALAASSDETQAQLRALQQRIERVSQEVGRDAIERDRLAHNLRDAEVAVAATRHDLEGVLAQESLHTSRRAALAAEREKVNASLARERTGLASQLRVAYLIGRSEPLQLLLNQRDPAAAARLYAYYGYFGRARAAQIDTIAQQVERIDALDAELGKQEAALLELRNARQNQLARLENGRAQRQSALASLQTEARSRAASLARLRSQQASLERLLRELQRAARPGPAPDNASNFGRLRGQLEWPLAGQALASYGQERASGVKWQGMVLAAEQGAPVRSIAAGRVIYADWLPGLGLLAIVDHGEGYLSLYGYNDQLRKSAGEAVAAGEVLAAAGDSGGRPRPELYFEIRRAGQPVDPRPWFRHPRPN
ncbi:MAG TPA: peptidoglycan DD-metalloendopeptidase family protein [Steroidobacteraceae bacterium]|nr:peptidoglycan DD-metalloendopeptidase family protein [Steroidobacteraceae bacterium]